MHASILYLLGISINPALYFSDIAVITHFHAILPWGHPSIRLCPHARAQYLTHAYASPGLISTAKFCKFAGENAFPLAGSRFSSHQVIGDAYLHWCIFHTLRLL